MSCFSVYLLVYISIYLFTSQWSPAKLHSLLKSRALVSIPNSTPRRCISAYLSICQTFYLSICLSIYLAMESRKTTKSFEEQSFCFDSEFNSAKKAGGGASLVALLRIVEEPGLVVQLLLSQISAIKKAINSQLTVMFLLF